MFPASSTCLPSVVVEALPFNNSKDFLYSSNSDFNDAYLAIISSSGLTITSPVSPLNTM